MSVQIRGKGAAERLRRSCGDEEITSAGYFMGGSCH